MTQTLTQLNLLDMVALTEDLPQNALLRGQVGTIVETLAPEVYEVEFSDDQGQTYAMLPLHSQQLMRLHYLPLTSASNPMSQIHQHGQGDNIAGDKVMGNKIANQTNFTQTNHGGTNSQNTISGGTVYQAGSININNSPEPKTPAEAAEEIKDLLIQLAKDNPLTTEGEKAEHVRKKLPPSRLQRITELIQTAGEAIIEDIPGGKIVMAVLKKVREQETSLNKSQGAES